MRRWHCGQPCQCGACAAFLTSGRTATKCDEPSTSTDGRDVHCQMWMASTTFDKGWGFRLRLCEALPMRQSATPNQDSQRWDRQQGVNCFPSQVGPTRAAKRVWIHTLTTQPVSRHAIKCDSQWWLSCCSTKLSATKRAA